MVHGIAWVDPAATLSEPRPWVLPEAPASSTAPAVVLSPSVAPHAAAWVRRTGITTLHVFSHRQHHKAARFVANVLTGAVPGLAASVRPTETTGLSLMSFATLSLARGQESPRTLAAIEAQALRTPTGVWLKRVSRLGHPNPSFGQHFRSLFPSRTGFVATLAPDAAVRHQPEPLVDADAGGVLLVGGEQPQASQWLAAAFPGRRTIVTEPVVEAAGVYGSPGVEFALVAPGPDLAASLVAQGTCPVCESALFTQSCPLCHVVPRQEAAA